MTHAERAMRAAQCDAPASFEADVALCKKAGALKCGPWPVLLEGA